MPRAPCRATRKTCVSGIDLAVQMELAELQRLLQAKERSIDSLRDTLATTKRTFEARLAQAESSLSLKEAEVRRPRVPTCKGSPKHEERRTDTHTHTLLRARTHAYSHAHKHS